MFNLMLIDYTFIVFKCIDKSFITIITTCLKWDISTPAGWKADAIYLDLNTKRKIRHNVKIHIECTYEFIIYD